MGPGSPSLRSVARDDSGVRGAFVFNCQTAKLERHLFFAGRGGSPVFPSLFPPPERGDGAPKGACSGLRRNVPGIAPPGDPEAPGLTHQSRVRPRLSTRHRGIRALAFYGSWTDRRRSAPDPDPQEPLGDVDVSATPASTASRPAIMTPHEVRPSADGTDGNINKQKNESRTIFTLCAFHLKSKG